jgi:hypothetical protein
MKAMLKKILIGLLIAFVVAQFFQPGRNNGTAFGAQDITHVVTVPDSVMGLLKTACFDCHSNQTKYPWYSKITPVNWWLKNHIDNGKKRLNFSTFATNDLKRKDHKLEEVAETVKKHAMPISSYLWIHKEARLNDAQRVVITDWVARARSELK